MHIFNPICVYFLQKQQQLRHTETIFKFLSPEVITGLSRKLQCRYRLQLCTHCKCNLIYVTTCCSMAEQLSGQDVSQRNAFIQSRDLQNSLSKEDIPDSLDVHLRTKINDICSSFYVFISGKTAFHFMTVCSSINIKIGKIRH